MLINWINFIQRFFVISVVIRFNSKFIDRFHNSIRAARKITMPKNIKAGLKIVLNVWNWNMLIVFNYVIVQIVEWCKINCQRTTSTKNIRCNFPLQLKKFLYRVFYMYDTTKCPLAFDANFIQITWKPSMLFAKLQRAAERNFK